MTQVKLPSKHILMFERMRNIMMMCEQPTTLKAIISEMQSIYDDAPKKSTIRRYCCQLQKHGYLKIEQTRSRLGGIVHEGVYTAIKRGITLDEFYRIFNVGDAYANCGKGQEEARRKPTLPYARVIMPLDDNAEAYQQQSADNRERMKNQYVGTNIGSSLA